MTSRLAAPRARFASAIAAVKAAPRDARVRRNTLSAVSVIVALALTGIPGTTALWVGSVTTSGLSLTSGSVSAAISGVANLTTTFGSGFLSKTTDLILSNTGASDATFTTAVTLSPTSSTALAAAISVTAWPSSVSCSNTTVAPGGAVTGTLGSFPQLSGTLTGGGTQMYCLRTRVAASSLSTTASVSATVKLNLAIPGTTWTSSATDAATQSVSADLSAFNDYTDAVLADVPSRYWRLGEPNSRIIYDWVGQDDAFGDTGLVRGVEGALVGDPNTATTFPNDATGMAGTRIAGTSEQSFAVEAWFKTTSTTGGKIVGFGGNSTGISHNNDRHIYLNPAGQINWGVWPGTARILSTTGAYNDGQWHHVVGSLGTNGQELYVDGARVGHDPATTSAMSYTGYWRIGGDNTWSGDYYFDGVIDEVAVYRDPLAAHQVKNHWNLSGRGSVPLAVADPYGSKVYADAPALYWRLGESTGTTAVDSLTGSNPGTYSGSVTKPAPDSLSNTRNTAASFGGTDGVVTSNTVFTNPAVYSLELWFNTTTTTGGKLIGFGDGGRSDGTSYSHDRHIYMQNDGKLRYGIYEGGLARTAVTPNAYNDGNWHHVVATQSSAGMIVYVDGNRVASAGYTTPEIFDGRWKVGGDTIGTAWPNVPTTTHITARIDEVAVYSSALSETEVKMHYAAATGAPVAKFTYTINGMQATFNGGGSTDEGGTITQYNWNFGDNATATGATPSHTYTTTGTHVVWLTVVDNSGKTSTSYQWVTATDITAPSVPARPIVTENTDTTAKLTWAAATDNVAVSGYDVYRDGVLLTTVTGRTFSDSGLTPNSTYSYTVRARDAAGNVSAASPAATFTAQFPTITAGVWYNTRNLASGKCVQGAGLAYGSLLQQYGCTANTNQTFQFVEVNPGNFRVESRAGAVMWDRSSTGRVHLYGYNAATNQQWQPLRQPNGSYVFRSTSSPALCVQFAGGASTDGTELWTAACDTTIATQQFTLTVIP
jgi:chitodextrinase